MKDLLPRILAAAASGLVLVFISAPANLHWLHWFSFVPLLWALRPDQRRANMALAYLSGWVAQFVIFFWLIETIIRFSNLPWFLAFLLHLIFTSVFALPYMVAFAPVHWFRQRLGLAWVLVLPAWLVATEYFLPQLFPYYQGHTHYRSPWVFQLASVTGVSGISYLVLLSNSALAEVLYRRREGRRPPWGTLAGVAAVLLANLGFGAWRYHAVEQVLQEAPTIRVGMLQQDVSMEERMSGSALQALVSWVRPTAKLDHPDLVVWPEGAIPFNPHGTHKSRALGDHSPREYFERMANHGHYDLLIGGGTLDRDEADVRRKSTSYNSVYLFGREAGLSDRYDKMIPLPFGEYIPLSHTFPWLRKVIQGPGDFQAGTRTTVFQGTREDGSHYTFAVPICYEAILDGQMRKMFRGEDPGPQWEGIPGTGAQGPIDLIVNITNDAWFGDTNSPHQHAMLVAAQATQLGRPLLRIAYTGVSFIVEPHGRILAETAPFTAVTAVHTLRQGKVDTIYVHGGYLFPYLCLLGVVVAWGVGRRRR